MPVFTPYMTDKKETIISGSHSNSTPKFTSLNSRDSGPEGQALFRDTNALAQRRQVNEADKISEV